jgi:hypothetical protein
MKRGYWMAVSALLLLAGCAAASGYDANRYASHDAGAPDPDTAPLPAQPKTTIPDPKHPAGDAGAAPSKGP